MTESEQSQTYHAGRRNLYLKNAGKNEPALPGPFSKENIKLRGIGQVA